MNGTPAPARLQWLPTPADAPAMTDTTLPTDDPIASTRLWLERIVIGLNLCPFA
ncbi:DUF1415 family protein, partial [Stenotrophomonas lactitubi]|uniref:DUF1415 family protein n=1 Tax=Stenotrophomonas lactitubi TaxID=2045214 RepID=UPI003DA75635